MPERSDQLAGICLIERRKPLLIFDETVLVVSPRREMPDSIPARRYACRMGTVLQYVLNCLGDHGCVCPWVRKTRPNQFSAAFTPIHHPLHCFDQDILLRVQTILRIIRQVGNCDAL